MKKLLSHSVTAALLGVSLMATDSSAKDGGGGGGGPPGACFTCSCSITGTIGGQTCWCPSTNNGGSGCKIEFIWGIGASCYVLEGPCREPVFGFAP